MKKHLTILASALLSIPSAAWCCEVVADTVGTRAIPLSSAGPFLVFTGEVESADACARLAETRTNGQRLRSSTTTCSSAIDGHLLFVVECIRKTDESAVCAVDRR